MGNKNLFDANKYDWSAGVGANYSIVNSNEVVVSSSNAWSRRHCSISGLLPNTQYTISAQKVNTQNLQSGFYISGSPISTAMTTTNGKIYLPFNSDEQGKATIQFYSNWSDTSVQHTVTYSDIQITEGSTAPTSYTPHKHQNYIIPTQQPMRKISDYADTFVRENGQWYEKHVIARVVLDGSEDWIIMRNKSTTISFAMSNINYMSDTKLYCTHFKQTASAGIVYNNDLEGIYISSRIQISIKKDRLEDATTEVNMLNSFKAYLKDNYDRNIPVCIEAVLINTTLLPCTEEQTAILEEIRKKAKSYKGGTHIYSTDEVSPIFDVEYHVDQQSENENLQSQLESLEARVSLLEGGE